MHRFFLKIEILYSNSIMKKIFNIKDLNLFNAVIEIDEVEYLINKEGVKAIKSGDKTILLKRIIDGEFSLISIRIINKAIKDKGIIDYLE